MSEDPSGESGVRLKRRVHAALAAVDPDAVKERAEKNRTDRCLRRWTSKAGVEEWLATLPAAQSIRAWAAIDALAREFIKDGRSETLDQARADAMIALIEGQSTISYVVTLGIPIPDHLAGDDLGTNQPDPSTPAPSNPSPDPRPEDDAAAQAAAPPAPENEESGLEVDTEHTEPEPRESAPAKAARGEGEAAVGHPSQGAAAPGSHDPVGDADRVSPHASDIPDANSPDPDEGDNSHPGALAADRAVTQHGQRTVAEVVAAALAALARHGNSDIEITGAGNPQPTDVNAAWVADALAKAARDGKVRLAAVHPSTGALIDPDNDHATTAYVPGKALTGLVKARDGRCRFPGCTLNVRFTDLDHVRPWPAGATSAENLHSLCRRHHRIKQLVGWHVALRPDGTTLWVDPIGRRYLTRALDHRGRPQAPPTPTPPAPERSLEQQTADQAAREKAIAHALRKEGPVSIFEEHLSHDLFDLDQEANRHAIRTGTARPWREHPLYDLHHHDRTHQHRAGCVGQGTTAGSTGPRSDHSGACGPAERGQQRQILIDLPSPTGADQSHRPRRVEYDEPPF